MDSIEVGNRSSFDGSTLERSKDLTSLKGEIVSLLVSLNSFHLYRYINPQELILRPIAASEKSDFVAGNRTPGLLI